MSPTSSRFHFHSLSSVDTFLLPSATSKSEAFWAHCGVVRHYSPSSTIGFVSDSYQLSRSHLCEFASIMAGLVFIVIPSSSSSFIFLALSFLLGFFLYIPFSFSELIAMENADARYTSIVISMNGLVSPFGSVFSGLPVNWVITKFGWNRLPSLLCWSFFSFSILLWVNALVQKRMKSSKDLFRVCNTHASQTQSTKNK